MAQYRVVCTIQIPPDRPNDRAHIVRAGTGTTTTHYDLLGDVAEVTIAIRNGLPFYTQGTQSGKIALAEVVGCSIYGHSYLRSSPDAVPDNNLDSLPRGR